MLEVSANPCLLSRPHTKEYVISQRYSNGYDGEIASKAVTRSFSGPQKQASAAFIWARDFRNVRLVDLQACRCKRKKKSRPRLLLLLLLLVALLSSFTHNQLSLLPTSSHSHTAYTIETADTLAPHTTTTQTPIYTMPDPVYQSGSEGSDHHYNDDEPERNFSSFGN